jgi:hypothetical protein
MADLDAHAGSMHVDTGSPIMLVHHYAGVWMLHALGNAGSVIAHLLANALGMCRV